jgi:hypothetical protein
MILEFNKKKRNFIVYIALFLISINLILLNPYLTFSTEANLELDVINISGENFYPDVPWLNNSGFDLPVYPWFSEIEGDISDVGATSIQGQADFEVYGDKRIFSNVSGTPTTQDWLNVTNPSFPALPDFHEIDEYGCEISHSWVDPTDPFQSLSVHWDRNITLPVDMSDYNITSVSINTIVNASVTPFGTSPLYRGGIDVEGDTVDGTSPDFTREYDYARFYVLISDLEKNDVFEISFNQTTNLGQDSGPTIANLTDFSLFTRPEESLISYLTTVLNNDPEHKSFTLSLGMRIFCTDNGQGDNDTWNSLRIKSCNLTFTYEKIIDQFTKASWEQEGKKISGSGIQITKANLNFKYKIDQTWPSLLSPNSELRVLINNKKHTETIKLSSATDTFQLAKSGGYDVSSLILTDINITVSIQVFLADRFDLDHNITVSITDAYLYISYIETYSDYIPEPLIYTALLIAAVIAASAIGGYLIAYQRVLKYPKPVRKIRKYRRSLKSDSMPSTDITSRESAFGKSFKKEINKASKFLRGESKQKIGVSEKITKISKNGG